MRIQKPSVFRRIMWMVFGIVGLAVFINAFGMIYMQRQLRLNAEATLRQYLVEGIRQINGDLTITTSAFYIHSGATLKNIVITYAGASNTPCASGKLYKDNFGFLFPMPIFGYFMQAQDIEICE